MPYKINVDEENPLWRKYMDELENMNLAEQTRWMKEIELPSDVPFAKKSFAAYTEEDFLKNLDKDPYFKEKWGTL